MSVEQIDVLAVMSPLPEKITKPDQWRRNRRDGFSIYEQTMAQVCEDGNPPREWAIVDAVDLSIASAAVAELIDADRELDAAVEAYQNVHSFSLGDREYVSAEDPYLLRLDAAKDRRAAALARIGGEA